HYESTEPILTGIRQVAADEAAALRKRMLERKRLEATYDRDTKKISTDPNNSYANLAVGKVLCFCRGDWRRGVSSLVKGSDPDLRAIAEADMGAQSENGAGEMELAIAAAD